MQPQTNLNLKENLKEQFVAFIDVMGFSNLVKSGKINTLESYFDTVTKVLDNISQSSDIIKSFLISDSIILISPKGKNGLVKLLHAIKKIQSELLSKKILLRGAVAFGEVYYNKNKNIIVGKGFIRAYLLEKEAIYPRVIIDPQIIKIYNSESPDKATFLKGINRKSKFNSDQRIIYSSSNFTKIKDDGIFIDYAAEFIFEYLSKIRNVYDTIVNNMYSEQSLYSKYIWLRDYFLESLKLKDEDLSKKPFTIQHKAIKGWIEIFEKL